jgi:hypothetical protein
VSVAEQQQQFYKAHTAALSLSLPTTKQFNEIYLLGEEKTEKKEELGCVL